MQFHAASGGLARTWRHDFLRGAVDIFPVIVASSPLGIVFGALAVKEGLTFPEGLLMSALVFAGVSQFATIQLWADPLPFWTIFLTTLAINFRHVLYSAALTRNIAHWQPPTRLFGLAFLVDTNFALAELNGGGRLSLAYYMGLSLPLYVGWSGATGLGLAFGALIQHPEAFGLDFVVTAFFVYLVASFRHRRNAAWIVMVSALGSVLTYLTFGSPWHFIGGAAPGIALAVALAGRKPVRA